MSRWDRVALLSMALGSALLGAVRCFGSDYASLAVSIPDDAYYYLLPAFNVSRLGSFTFDGIHPTFGFQPLWAALLALLGALCPDRESFLRAALFTSEVLHAATAVVLGVAGWRVGRQRGQGRSAGWFAAALFLANVPFLRASTNGMESALYGLLLAVCAARAVDPAPDTPAGQALSGLLLGLLPFARLTPGSVATMLALGFVASKNPRALVALSLTLTLGLVAERMLLGHWLPTSGAMKLLGSAAGLKALGGAGWLKLACSMLGYPLNHLLYGLGLPSAFGYAEKALLSAPLFALGILAVLRTRRGGQRASGGGALAAPDHRSSPAALVALVAALMAAPIVPLMLNHRGVELYYCAWYATEAPVLIPLVFASAMAVLKARESRAAGLAGVLAVSLAAGLAVTGIIVAERPLSGLDVGNATWGTWQRAIWEGAQRANQQVPPGERIGAFNAGLLGYACDRTVVNLDGLANDDILGIEGVTSIYDYVRGERITWMIDALPPAGWFGGQGRGYQIVDRIPFEAPGFEGYVLARVTAVEPEPAGDHGVP